MVFYTEKKWVFNEVNEVVFGNEINKSVLKEDYSIESDYDIEKINTQFSIKPKITLTEKITPTQNAMINIKRVGLEGSN